MKRSINIIVTVLICLIPLVSNSSILKTRTLAIIKPHAYKAMGKIISKIQENGFYIENIKSYKLSLSEARVFYNVHASRPFYENLCKMMSSGRIVIMELSKLGSHTVEDFRKLLGFTDSTKAQKGTIRAEFGKDKQENAVHGSDSNENAEKEINFFFK